MLLFVPVIYSFLCAVRKTVVRIYPNHLSVFIHGIVGGPLDDLFGGIMYKVAMIILVSCFLVPVAYISIWCILRRGTAISQVMCIINFSR